jgi:hypothetical protein
MKWCIYAGILAALASLPAGAESFREYPDLPPLPMVVQAMESYPAVLAAKSGIKVEEANRSRLEAGSYEYNVRLGSQRRTETALNQRYKEWEMNVERPFRLPGKASLDEALGKQGVEVSQWMYGDALHEAGRSLLSLWFAWYREHFQAAQWQGQVEALSRQLDTVNKRVRAGDAARLEAMLAEAALAQAEAALGQATLRERMASTTLTSRFGGISPPANPVLALPAPLSESPAYWREEILRHNHELGVARAETRRWQLQASRSAADRAPDPTVGLRYASERDGTEKIVGLNLTIPLPGSGRAAVAQGSAAQAEMAAHREAGVMRKVEVEATMAYATASSAYDTWQKMRQVADKMQANADLMFRAYSLGEAGLPEVLTARRQALEAGLVAVLAQVDAAESRYRLLLDAHQLWPLDVDEDEGKGKASKENGR